MKAREFILAASNLATGILLFLSIRSTLRWRDLAYTHALRQP